MTLAVSENHSTMVADFSVRTSRRTSSIATAEIDAEASAATTPIASRSPRPAPSPANSVSFGHEMMTTPTKPTATALQR